MVLMSMALPPCWSAASEQSVRDRLGVTFFDNAAGTRERSTTGRAEWRRAMPQTVRDVMTPDPVTLPASAKVSDAAKLMRDRDIGTIIVLKGDGKLCGLV